MVEVTSQGDVDIYVFEVVDARPAHFDMVGCKRVAACIHHGQSSRRGLDAWSRDKKTAPRIAKMNPPLRRWVPSSYSPASLTTKDICNSNDCVGSLEKRDGSPSCSAGGGIPIS